ncbi:MAG: UvrD-helicase domain-containing protein, partial [Phycisphaerales bacterium]|nr:UvrD-helicase domain-containing protein [Phycisphaerales bacterium]
SRMNSLWTQESDPAQSPHVIVRASAGSGKTYRLTNEFISKLFKGEDAAGMLATTFTRVAAGEILHRVLHRLSAGVVDPKEREDLARSIPDHEITADRCAEVLEGLISRLHRLSILTIDSFFSRLASSHSFELGLPATYRLLSEDEDQELRERTVDHSIRESTTEELVGLLRLLQGQAVQMRTHSAIMQIIDSGYAMYLATGGDPSPWKSIQPCGQPSTSGEIERALDRFRDADLPTTQKGEVNKNWFKAQKATIEVIEKQDWQTFLDKGLGKAIRTRDPDTGVVTYSKKEMPLPIYEELSTIFQHAVYELTMEHFQRTISTFRLLQRFDGLYRAAKMNSGMLNFDDPPRLLNDAQVTGDLEHLYYRLDTTLRHLMLDEFQDTSMPQFNLLAPILDELLSQNEEERSVFVVGDVKQSLYTWRQAEPKLLGAMIDRWETLEEQTLSKSWRSSSVVLDAVNEIFGTLTSNIAMVNPVGAAGTASAQSANSAHIGKIAAHNWDEQYDQHEAAKDIPGFVSLKVAERDEESDPDPVSEVLWSCANTVAEVQTQCPGASIAVLVRQGKHIYPLLARLKKLGIDACEDRGNPLVDSPSVAAAVSMLGLIEHPGNSAALYHVRSTPLGEALGIYSSESLFELTSRLRDRCLREGCVPMLCEWLEHCAESMDARGHQRFEQLIELASTLESEGRSDPSTLARVAQERRIEEPGHSPVRVITIHRSKGLEFDAVVLPLMDSQWQVRSGTLLSERADPLDHIQRVTITPNEVLRSIHPELQSIHEQALLKQINEELCCLYVAMTRAKRSLQMIIAEDKNGRDGIAPSNLKLCPAHIVHAAFAKDLPCKQGSTLYEADSAHPWHEGLATEPQLGNSKQSPEPMVLRVQPAKRVSAGRLNSAAPSSLGSDSLISARSVLQSTNSGEDAKQFGLLVHACFELIDWFDPTMHDASFLQSKLMDMGFSDDVVTDAVNETLRTLDTPAIQRSFDQETWLADHPEACRCKIFHEHPFAVRLKIGRQDRLVQGRVDRLVIGWSAADPQSVCCAQIIDFKTDREASGLNPDELKSLAEYHAPQMEAYRAAIGQMYRLEPDRIEVDLLYTKAPGLIRLT